MTTENSKDQAARTEALKRTIEKTTGMPAANVAAGGRSLAEESARFIQSSHEAAKPKR